MEWSRVKSILICVFVAVNIFLIAVYINGSTTEITVDAQTVSNTVTVLKNNNISVDKNLIPTKSSDMPVFNITSAKPSVSEYATVLWENAKANGGDYFNPDYCKTENDTVTYTAAEQGTVADVKKNIKKTGILDKFNYRCLETEESLEYKIVFDNCSVEDIWVKASLSGGTVTVTAKNCLGGTVSEAGYCTVKTAPEILISFASAIKPKNPVKIVSMEKAYIAGSRSGEIRTVTVSPVWKITAADNAVYYIDMRNGDLLSV